jgi:Ribonuclease G/E
MRRLFVASERGPLRLALIGADDRLEGVWQFSAGRESLVGERFLGRVLTVDRGLGTAFVDIGLAKPGFLPLSASPTPPVEGQAVTVEVSRDPVGGKGARLNGRIGEAVALPAGSRPPMRLSHDGPLRRLIGRLGGEVSVHADTRRVAEELAALAVDVPVGRKISVEHRPQRDWPLSMVEIESEIAAALEPKVELHSGAWLLFEPGQTLTAVDVNSGTAQGSAASSNGERLWLKINLEAAKEIARQLRLRHIGGIIVVDFIDVKDAMARRQVSETLRQATAEDWEPCWVGSMSRLGLVERTRRRGGPTLAEMWGPKMRSPEMGSEKGKDE